MEPLKMAKQMIDFNKATFDNSFSSMVMLQEQTEKMVSSFVDQAAWLPEEGKKALKEWLATYKKGREEYKKMVDEGYKKVDSFFADATKSTK
jgi:polyhydroxyalkanoate synthesis regulator phasin